MSAGPALPAAPTVAERVAAHLEPYLGPLNARVAVKTFAQRNLSVAAETLTAAHLPALLDGLRPMLHTFIGRASTDVLLDTIRRDVR